jgi:hypothetical protein
VDSLFAMVMVDKHGHHVEVIVLDRGRGPHPWIRVSLRGYLIGPGTQTPHAPGWGYYRTIDEALRHVDIESLIEIVTLPLQHS